MAVLLLRRTRTAIVIDYPLKGSVFPQDVEAPTFLWGESAKASRSWRIDVAFANGAPVLLR